MFLRLTAKTIRGEQWGKCAQFINQVLICCRLSFGQKSGSWNSCILYPHRGQVSRCEAIRTLLVNLA